MPKSSEQYEEMRRRSTSAIAKAALNLFVTNGYHSTSINSIAREAGIANGLMYHYFRSKEDLLVYILQDHFRQIRESTLEALAGAGDTMDIRTIIDSFFSAIRRNSEPWRLIITVMFQPDVAASARQLLEGLLLHQDELYEKCFQKAGVSRPEVSAKTLTAVMHGAMLAYAMSSNDEDLQLIRENVIERMLKDGV